MPQPKILIAIVAYNAREHIASVLDRIPADVKNNRHFDATVLILDDASTDGTVEQVRSHILEHYKNAVYLGRNPINQGYGGNQKIAYRYAIHHGYDAVVLLHGDGQYPPEMIGNIVSPIIQGEADVVLGSRMLKKNDALKGGMPLYKWVGNMVLTKIQNWMLSSRLSEFHTGFRAYRVTTLDRVPFEKNSSDFDFDTEILIQCIQTGQRIREIAIPTRYGDEVCHVNGPKYFMQCLKACILSRTQYLNIWYRPQFDYAKGDVTYSDKASFPSSHSLPVSRIAAGAKVLGLGCTREFHVSKKLLEKGCSVTAASEFSPASLPAGITHHQINLDTDNLDFIDQDVYSDVLLLDVIEHLENPEQFMARLRLKLQLTLPTIHITSPNIAFIIVRLQLLLGQFNYGKRGILDSTHKRLFTFASLKRFLISSGYVVEKSEGIPLPFALVIRNETACRLLTKFNLFLIRFSKSLFSYQIAMVARPTPELEWLIKRANIAPYSYLSPSAGSSDAAR